MIRANRSKWLLASVVAALMFVWAACGGDDGGPSDPAQTGSIQVTATTTGDDLDADGYTVAMDGGASRESWGAPGVVGTHSRVAIL